MKLSVVLSIDMPKGSRFESLVPRGPQWAAITGIPSDKQGGWFYGNHRGMTAVLTELETLDLIRLFKLNHKDPVTENNTLMLSICSYPDIVAHLYITPEKEFIPRWAKLASKLTAALC